VTSFSTNGLIAFALGVVVMMRSCRISEFAMFFVMAMRCSVVRPSRFPAQRCLMGSSSE
jgi:hypothetical protein